MAEAFLESLPRIEKSELPDHSECAICQQEYDTKPFHGKLFEYAVRLPCQHIFGSDCIESWLSPFKEGKNTCPFCRQQFFRALPCPYMGHELMEVSVHPDLNRLIAKLGHHGYIATQYGWEWDELNHGVTDSEVRLREAKAYLETESQGFTTKTVWEEHGFQDLDDWHTALVGQAAALQTWPLRESIVYLQLQSCGANLPKIEQPLQGLNANEEDALFQEIEDTGTFEIHFAAKRGRGLSNRDIWQNLRECGNVCQICLNREGKPAIKWYTF